MKAKATLKYINLIILLLSSIVSAQNVILAGRILDQVGQPMGEVNVRLLDSDFAIKEHTTTDNLGKYTLTISSGSYYLQFEQFGTELYKKEIVLVTDMKIDDILVDNTIELEGFTITTKKKLIQRKVDRLVFNVENSIVSSGGNGLDVLRVTPNLTVQNDIVSILGKSSVSVMVNERLIDLSGMDLMNFIKSLNASDIQKVEVVTTPPAKYQAQGNSGIINIILKKNVSNSWNNVISSNYTQSTYPLLAFNESFTYNRNKLAVGLNMNYSKGATATVEKNDIYYVNQTWDEINNRKDYSNYLRTRLFIDYKWTKNISTSFQYNLSSSRPKFDQNDVVELKNTLNSSIDSLLVNIGNEIEKSYLHTYNFNLVYKIDTLKNRKIVVDFDVLDYKIKNNRVFTNRNFLSQNEIIDNSYFSGDNHGKQNVENYSVNIDVDHPIKFIDLNYGVRASFSHTRNALSFYNLTSGVPIIDENQTDLFNYKENIQAAYFSAKKQLGEKWEAQAGLRFENTQTTGISHSINRKNEVRYSKLFPTAYILYNINDKNSININYGRRINRPTFNWLNPFKNYSSLYFYVEGNPFLEPSFSHNLELNYIYNTNLNVQLYYSKVEGGYGQLSFVDPNDISLSYAKPVNYLEEDYVGFNVSYILNKIDWWESISTFNLNYVYSKSSVPVTNNNLEGSNAYLRLDNTFKFSESLSLNLNYFYAFKGVEGLYKRSSSSQLNAIFRVFFYDRKIQASIFANDIFRTNKPSYTSYSNNVKIKSSNYYDLRSIGLSIVYRFGNDKLKSIKYSSNEQQSRL